MQVQNRSRKIFLDLIEDTLTIGLAALAAFHTVVILAVILVFAAIFIWLAPKAIRAIRHMLAQVGSMFGMNLSSRLDRSG